jgi:MSHA biogenesis protein MshO
MTEPRHQFGFSLIELVIVITILGVLGAILSTVVVQPFQAAQDQTQRAQLLDQADLIIERIRREVRTAVPNSVRVREDGVRTAVEFVPSNTGGRYRRLPAPGGGGDPLNRAQSSDTFDVLGCLPDIDEIDYTSGGGKRCTRGKPDCINVFNTRQTDFNIYAKDNIAELTNVKNAGDCNTNALKYQNDGETPAFEAHSPNQRFFVFDDVVSFVCDTGTGELYRYSTYGLIKDPQPLTESAFDSNTDVDRQLVADQLDTNQSDPCVLSYSPGAAKRQGVLQVEIALANDGETVELFGQVHVVNAP